MVYPHTRSESALGAHRSLLGFFLCLWLFFLSELAEKSTVLSIPSLVLLSFFLILHETEPTHLCSLVTDKQEWVGEGVVRDTQT